VLLRLRTPKFISLIDLFLRFDYQGLPRLTHSHLIDDYNS